MCWGDLFWAAGKLDPGLEDIKYGLNRAVRPRFGLILAVRGATGPRMPLEALNAQKPFEKLKNQ